MNSRHSRLLASVLGALAFLLAAGPGWSLEIIYPPDKTVVSRTNYLIIRGGDNPQLDGVSIELGGYKTELLDLSQPEYRAAFGDFLIVEPVLDPGRNLILVKGYVKGEEVASARSEVYFAVTPGASAPKDYRPFAMHSQENEAKCTGCHNMAPSPEELAADNAKTNPCGSCHARRLAQDYVHGPAGVYQCTYCHQVDSRPVKYQPRAENAALCNECHQDKVDEFTAKKFVHGPVEAGLCQVCHDPHASDTYGQLVKPVNELCLDCHEAVKRQPHVLRGVGGKAHPLMGEADPNRPGRELTCVGCHDPHGGQSEAYFQGGISSRMALCQLCHKK
ncbi:c-type cytochrome [Desulfuromonas versatilis]|uniref:C-type cytochrome n=1 Tax=Desulfuromonas versatilis TaxID=2802975 RepID=A0ABN6DUY2_9BACT|nr:cytochrome c3 family protein [Desulfuromonas versatilis]BCR03931.1 c-type cytochrome [Desulfuromonas versatilis]